MPIRIYADFFRAALSGKLGSVGLSVVENIPLPVNIFNAAMGISQTVQGILGTSSLKSHISDIYDCPAINIIPVRPAADRIAQFVAEDRGIYKIIGASDFTDGAGLKKLMAHKACPLTVRNGGQKQAGLRFQGNHILFQRHHLGALLPSDMLLMHGRVAGIQIDFPIIIYENTGIKLSQIILPSSQYSTVRMLHKAQEFIASRRRIANRNADFRKEIQTII